MRFKIAIVEDDKQSAKILASYINRYSEENNIEIDIMHYNDGDEIVYEYKPIYDIIFLDIEMRLLDGVTAAKHIRKLDKDVIIIFVTNMPQYALKGYEVGALNYLLKPITYFAFSLELKRAAEKIQSKENSYLIFSTKDETIRLHTSEVAFIESMKHKLIIHARGEQYVITGTMKEIENKLTKFNFFRCNNCYLVNLARVTGVKDNFVIIDEYELLISRPRKKAFMEALTKFFGDMIL
ncbi:MAG TPA: response regulator transcription factor [Clostridiales bacterium]|nr:response regulator transcription factor [Clostridiales bacterium]